MSHSMKKLFEEEITKSLVICAGQFGKSTDQPKKFSYIQEYDEADNEDFGRRRRQ